ncbi:MAG TPA: ABC transporter permease [Kofleriaceae bacterium]|nr:ABC transporter permease [Kofleriaceae bacterium]
MPIGPFLLRRLGSSALAVLGVSLLVFLALHIVPGDPVDRLAGGDATPEQRADMARCMHLDEPLPVQFAIFLRGIASGTLGRQCPDLAENATVMQRVREVFPYTVELALGGMLVALVLALPLGVVAAVRRGSWVDAVAAVVSLSGISIPTMWMGPILISIFTIELGWLPGPAEPDAAFALVMPSVVVGTHLMAMLSRMTRSSLVEVLGEDFMTTARAKGLPEWLVIARHGLRNALLPVITVAGLQFGALLGGAIITEKVFARPGLGTLLLDGISERNYPVVQGAVLVIAVSYVAVNLLVDLTYGLADPRVRRA